MSGTTGRTFDSLLSLPVDRTIHPEDGLAASYAAAGGEDAYFVSASQQADFLSKLVLDNGMGSRWGRLSIADYACHFGRLTRALVRQFPVSAVYAYDINPTAIEFCADQFGAVPVLVDWLKASGRSVAPKQDLLICVSLLTHTSFPFAQRVMRRWAEGAHLEPDRRFGYAYLDATARVLGTYKSDKPSRITQRSARLGHADMSV